MAAGELPVSEEPEVCRTLCQRHRSKESEGIRRMRKPEGAISLSLSCFTKMVVDGS